MCTTKFQLDLTKFHVKKLQIQSVQNVSSDSFLSARQPQNLAVILEPVNILLENAAMSGQS